MTKLQRHQGMLVVNFLQKPKIVVDLRRHEYP